MRLLNLNLFPTSICPPWLRKIVEGPKTALATGILMHSNAQEKRHYPPPSRPPQVPPTLLRRRSEERISGADDGSDDKQYRQMHISSPYDSQIPLSDPNQRATYFEISVHMRIRTVGFCISFHVIEKTSDYSTLYLIAKRFFQCISWQVKSAVAAGSKNKCEQDTTEEMYNSSRD